MGWLGRSGWPAERSSRRSQALPALLDLDAIADRTGALHRLFAGAEILLRADGRSDLHQQRQDQDDGLHAHLAGSPEELDREERVLLVELRPAAERAFLLLAGELIGGHAR